MDIARSTIYTTQSVADSQRAQGLLWLSVLAIGGGLAVLWLLFALVGGREFTLLTLEATYVVLPALALVMITVFLVVTLWQRDGVLPVFELGVVCAMTTALYSLFPLLGFLFAGLTWTSGSDLRLLRYNPAPADVGGFAWRHVLYLLSFVAIYLVARGTASVRQPSLEMPDRPTRTMIVFLFLVLTGYFLLLQVAFGVSYSAPYADLRAGVGSPSQLPYFLQQISHNLQGMSFVLKQCLVMLLLWRWRVKKYRYVLVIWLLVEVVTSVLRMGARYHLVLLLLSVVLLYHRLVRRLTFRKAVLVGSAGLFGFLLYGWARQYGGDLGAVFRGGASLWSANNEFQVLFGTAYDLYRRKSLGGLSVPWQLYVSDLYMIIPSQLLPFYKWAPSEWYLELLGMRGTGQGYMFGVISQAIIGLDWVELVLRGALLGYLFARIHHWYVRRSSQFWVTLLYVFLCVWSYYTYRGTTFSLIYMVVYRFIPAVLLVRAGGEVLKK